MKKMHNKEYKYIFFDIFDTIVSRKIQPEYTKKIWANHLVKTLDLKISMTEVYNIRNKIEYQLGEKSSLNGNDWEFTYNDLIKEIYNEINIQIPFKKFLSIATNIEIDIESSVLIPDQKIVKEIKNLRKEGKKIYCVSDMYLSKEMIKNIFKNLKIDILFDDFFISCEYLKNKKSGSLYDLVLKKLKANPKNCLMIGDNYNSDYENPKSKKIEAIHLDRTEKYKEYEKYHEDYNEEKVLTYFEKLKNTKTDNFEHAIFTLYQFTEKLYYQLLNDELDEVFFLSREGEYLKKLFDYYVETIHGKKIKSHYILVSRKATYLPSLKSLDKEDFSKLLHQYVYISVKEFLGSLNFTEEELKSILDSFSQDCKKLIGKVKLKEQEEKEMKAIIDKKFDTKIIYLYESNILKYLKQNKKFIEIYEKKRIEQSNLFKKYIKSFTNKKEICVVDIGWNGSIQDNIQNILGKDYKISGYLYGLVSRDYHKSKNKKGLIFSNIPKPSKNFDLFYENRTVYEISLGASHGSANKYVEKDKKVEVSTFEKKEEHDMFTNVISKIQDKMFDIYSELLRILPNGYYSNLKIDKEINRIHFKMLFKPTEEQLKFFNKIYHYENFGVFEFTEFNLQKKLNLKYYIKENLKYFLKHKSFFYDAFWPVLKLSNEKLYIQKFLYIEGKKLKLKRRDII